MSQDDYEHQLIYFESEEHLVRRLGAALVSYWSELPSGTQSELIERSIMVLDEDHSEHLAEQMKRFIAAHTRPRPV
jgi:hypothetical protein